MRLLLLFIVLVFTYTSFSQATNKIDAKGKKQGEWVKKSKDKKYTLYKGEFKDDYPVGKFTFYYPNGKVKAINVYSNKGKDSYAAAYFDNGKVMSYGKYVNQKKDSTWIYYDNAGNLSSTEEYTDGMKNGKSITYYPWNLKKHGGSPKVLEEINYVNDKKEGAWAKYFKNGDVMAEGMYKNDEYDGKQIYYHSNKEKHHVFNYKNGDKNGYSYSYDKSGEVISKVYYYKDMKLQGDMLKKHLEKMRAKKKAELENKGN